MFLPGVISLPSLAIVTPAVFGACRTAAAAYMGQYIISEQSVADQPFVWSQISSGALSRAAFTHPLEVH